MRDFSWLKKACAVFVVCSATAIAAQAQTLKVLANFNGPNGEAPQLMSLIQSTDGNLYGVTYDGGDFGYGTVFKMTLDGALTTLYSFCAETDCQDGVFPTGALVLATNGDFYGTTYNGGNDITCVPRRTGCGTVFKLTSAGKLTTLYTFCAQRNCSDGDAPLGSLIQAIDGNVYGTTTQGGTSNSQCPLGCGTIFKVSPEGVLTTLHAFDYSDGYAPWAGVIQATDGNLYGTTSDYLCNPNCETGPGTVFRITPRGVFTTMHIFTYTDGANPFAPLVQASDGRLYGTTFGGGNENQICDLVLITSGCGTIFRMSLDGHLKTVYDFCSQPNCNDGYYPEQGVIQGTDGNLYGTTIGGLDLFTLSPSGSFTTLQGFNYQTGLPPDNGLLQATNGLFYGATSGGGGYQDGTLFSLATGLEPFVSFLRPAGKVGQTGPILGQGFTGTSSVSLNGIPARFTVVSDTFIRATVPAGATTGYVTVTTPSGTLTSNVPFYVIT